MRSREFIVEQSLTEQYRSICRRIVEDRTLTPHEIRALFGNLENILTQAGGNRTILGQALDAVGYLQKLKNYIIHTGPLQSATSYYNDLAQRLQSALVNSSSPEAQAILSAVQRYRQFAEQHPVLQKAVYAIITFFLAIALGHGATLIISLIKLVDSFILGKSFWDSVQEAALTGIMAEFFEYLLGAANSYFDPGEKAWDVIGSTADAMANPATKAIHKAAMTRESIEKIFFLITMNLQEDAIPGLGHRPEPVKVNTLANKLTGWTGQAVNWATAQAKKAAHGLTTRVTANSLMTQWKSTKQSPTETNLRAFLKTQKFTDEQINQAFQLLGSGKTVADKNEPEAPYNTKLPWKGVNYIKTHQGWLATHDQGHIKKGHAADEDLAKHLEQEWEKSQTTVTNQTRPSAAVAEDGFDLNRLIKLAGLEKNYNKKML
jgi:hypothetical protein